MKISKQDVVQQLQEAAEGFQKKIDDLRNSSDQASEDVMQELKEKKSEMQQRIDDLKDMSDEKSEEFQQKAQESLGHLKTAWNKIVQKMQIK